MAGLDVDEEDGVRLFGPAIHLIDDFVRHDHPVLAGLARLPLGHHRDQVQGGLDRQRRISLLPLGRFPLQPPQHLVLGVLAQGPHLLGQRVAIVGDDALARQDRTRQRRRGFHRPAAALGKLGVLAGVVFARGGYFPGRWGIFPFGLPGGLLTFSRFLGFGRSRRLGFRGLGSRERRRRRGTGGGGGGDGRSAGAAGTVGAAGVLAASGIGVGVAGATVAAGAAGSVLAVSAASRPPGPLFVKPARMKATTRAVSSMGANFRMGDGKHG